MLPLDEMLPVQQGGLQKGVYRELKVESRWLAGALRRRPVASNQAAAVLHQTAHRCEEGTSEGNIADNVAEGAHVRRTPTGLCACIGFAPCLLLIGLLVVGFNCAIAHNASYCTPSQRAAILHYGDDTDDDMPALEHIRNNRAMMHWSAFGAFVHR